MQLAFPGIEVPGWGRGVAQRVQRAGHEPRHHHDLLGGDARADRGLRELPDPAHDRLRRHGLPADQPALLPDLPALSAVVLLASFFVEGGGFGGAWTAYPPLSSKAEYSLTPLGSTILAAGRGPRVRRLPARRHQLRHHRHELPRAGHEALRHPDGRLDDRDREHPLHGVGRPADRRRHHAVLRPEPRDRLLRPGPRRRPDPLAAPLLVLRSPRGLRGAAARRRASWPRSSRSSPARSSSPTRRCSTRPSAPAC